MKSSLTLLLLLLSVAALTFTACPSTGIVCRAGTTRCGDGCADYATDRRNCGGCGIGCAEGQECVDSNADGLGECTCRAGTTSCGGACAVLSYDVQHCGGCNIACRADQTCTNSACVCPPGTTSCNGACVNTATDATHCGSCTTTCGANEVCSGSQCVTSCGAGLTQCGTSCVDVMTDRANCNACGTVCAATKSCVNGACACATGQRLCAGSCLDTQTDVGNCGGCGVACGTAQHCQAGVCQYDLVAACYWTGQVAGLRSSDGQRGAWVDLGSNPGALASYNGVVLAADGTDRRLNQAAMGTFNAVPGGGFELSQLAWANRTGVVPNQVLVEAPYVYLVNATSGTLQVLMAGADAGTDVLITDGGQLSGSVPLATIAELNLGQNTYPEGLVKVGTSLWIPLYGGGDSTTASAGQKVLEVSVATPTAPSVVNTVDLSTLNLHAFDGGHPVPRPWAITTHQGVLYVALNNLNADTWAPEGPGLLARIDPTTRAATVINLGADACLNPQWLASDGQRLVVSCLGLADYSGPNYTVVGTDKAGLVMLANDVRVATWAPSCPADAGSACAVMLPGRFALSAGRAYLGDQNGGRVYVLDVSDAGFGERRGYFGDAGAPIQACAPSAAGLANVSDVLALP